MLIDLKQDLINKISATDDENLLQLLKNDFEYFTNDGGQDVTDEISNDEKAELVEMVSEPFGSETVTQQEFDEAIQLWRTK